MNWLKLFDKKGFGCLLFSSVLILSNRQDPTSSHGGRSTSSQGIRCSHWPHCQIIRRKMWKNSWSTSKLTTFIRGTPQLLQVKCMSGWWCVCVCVCVCVWGGGGVPSSYVIMLVGSPVQMWLCFLFLGEEGTGFLDSSKRCLRYGSGSRSAILSHVLYAVTPLESDHLLLYHVFTVCVFLCFTNQLERKKILGGLNHNTIF